MIRYPSADAQQAAVIKRRTWGGAPVLSGCRSGGCWNSRCIGFCQRFCNRFFQPPLQLRRVGIYSYGCKQGCFQPPRPSGSGPGLRSGLGFQAAGWQSTPGALRPVYGTRGMSQRAFDGVQCWLSWAAAPDMEGDFVKTYPTECKYRQARRCIRSARRSEMSQSMDLRTA